ncbi:hypothetical protein QP028_06080 [Corynebacterium suedekumii]|nr:hypothetical protein QP028_06080 [Corynebacterium suedekumii]
MSNSRWTQPAGRTTGDFILVAVGDPALHPEATHVAAATGYAVMDSADPREISRLHTRARAVLVDADIAAHVSTLARRPGVYFLAADPGPVDWQAALNCHAEHAYVLPAQAAELLTELGHADAAPRIPDHPGSGGADHASTVIAVLGAAGERGPPPSPPRWPASAPPTPVLPSRSSTPTAAPAGSTCSSGSRTPRGPAGRTCDSAKGR